MEKKGASYVKLTGGLSKNAETGKIILPEIVQRAQRQLMQYAPAVESDVIHISNLVLCKLAVWTANEYKVRLYLSAGAYKDNNYSFYDSDCMSDFVHDLLLVSMESKSEYTNEMYSEAISGYLLAAEKYGKKAAELAAKNEEEKAAKLAKLAEKSLKKSELSIDFFRANLAWNKIRKLMYQRQQEVIKRAIIDAPDETDETTVIDMLSFSSCVQSHEEYLHNVDVREHIQAILHECHMDMDVDTFLLDVDCTSTSTIVQSECYRALQKKRQAALAAKRMNTLSQRVQKIGREHNGYTGLSRTVTKRLVALVRECRETNQYDTIPAHVREKLEQAGF